MVDTARTLSELQTIFADNTTGDISAQDQRDFLVTALTTTSIQAVTTADLFGKLATHHYLDVSGMTADRNYIIPAGEVGDIMQVTLSAGSDNFALIIKGDTGITVGGASPGGEWSRIFITDETVTLKAVSSTKWIILADGRIPCHCRLDALGGIALPLVDQTWVVHPGSLLTNAAMDNANMADTANGRINIRRTGDYIGSCSTQTDPLSGHLRINMKDNIGTDNHVLSPNVAHILGEIGGNLATSPFYVDIATVNYLYVQTRMSSATAGVDLTASRNTFIDVLEQL